ncbi:MAG TPA: DUF1015 domain-containing protein [Actinomycetota bacterium]|nr:DUF1015 domain-containing protein [Actinomycetota bacterium]
MPELLPFHATRFVDDDPALVCAPPYDVISPEQREAFAALDPHNIVHVTLPSKTADGVPDYSGAGRLWQDWISQGVLREDSDESLFLYSAEFQDGSVLRTVAGIIGCIELSAFGEGGVHPHEKTRPGPKQDRLELMKATSANLEPLWFLSSQPLTGISQAIALAAGLPPLADVTDAQGVRHRIWRVDDQIGALPKVPDGDLVVADGHHRYETSITYRDLRRAQDGSGGWDQTLALVMDPIELAPVLLPIHRIASVTPEQVARVADLSPITADIHELASIVADRGPGTVGLVHATGAWTFASKPLDTTFLAEQVIAPLGAEVEYEHDPDQVAKAVSQGSSAFILAPITTEEVTKSAVNGLRMPPKTTLFWPKPLSGPVMRQL